MVSGLDLKVERVRLSATQRDVARHMGVSAARVSTIERSDTVEPAMATRWRQALAQVKADRADSRPTTMRYAPGVNDSDGSMQADYKAHKRMARAFVRKQPWVRVVEVDGSRLTGLELLGAIDGLMAAEASCRVLDHEGQIVNRRVE